MNISNKLRHSMHSLARRMMSKEASQRPCLGTLLGLKCRSSNTHVCDGTGTDCLYGSAVSRSELGTWPERFVAHQQAHGNVHKVSMGATRTEPDNGVV